MLKIKEFSISKNSLSNYLVYIIGRITMNRLTTDIYLNVHVGGREALPVVANHKLDFTD